MYHCCKNYPGGSSLLAARDIGIDTLGAKIQLRNQWKVREIKTRVPRRTVDISDGRELVVRVTIRHTTSPNFEAEGDDN